MYFMKLRIALKTKDSTSVGEFWVLNSAFGRHRNQEDKEDDRVPLSSLLPDSKQPDITRSVFVLIHLVLNLYLCLLKAELNRDS